MQLKRRIRPLTERERSERKAEKKNKKRGWSKKAWGDGQPVAESWFDTIDRRESQTSLSEKSLRTLWFHSFVVCSLAFRRQLFRIFVHSFVSCFHLPAGLLCLLSLFSCSLFLQVFWKMSAKPKAKGKVVASRYMSGAQAIKEAREAPAARPAFDVLRSSRAGVCLFRSTGHFFFLIILFFLLQFFSIRDTLLI